MPSLVAEIGAVVEHHLRRIGLITDEPLSHEHQQLVAEKRAQAQALEGTTMLSDYPQSATLCFKCHTKAMVVLDNCKTCLSCGYSRGG